MKIKATALSNSSPKEWVLLPTIIITSQSPFYIILQNKYNHKKASNQIKDPNHLKAITNNHQPQKQRKIK